MRVQRQGSSHGDVWCSGEKVVSRLSYACGKAQSFIVHNSLFNTVTGRTETFFEIQFLWPVVLHKLQLWETTHCGEWYGFINIVTDLYKGKNSALCSWAPAGIFSRSKWAIRGSEIRKSLSGVQRHSPDGDLATKTPEAEDIFSK